MTVPKRVLSLALVVVFAACDTADPTAIETGPDFSNAGGIVHHVSLGGNDACEASGLAVGCDKNFSFTANVFANGDVQGVWHDGINGASDIHVTVDCVVVDGNQAWISGVIERGPRAGLSYLTWVQDNGRTGDLMSFSIRTAVTCDQTPPVNQLALTRGQVVIRSR